MKIKYFVSALLVSLCLVFSDPLSVFASGIVSPIIWDGVVSLSLPSSIALFNGGLNGYSTTTDSYINPDFAVVNYSGNINTFIDISSNQIGTYLNGSIQKRVVFTINNPSNGTFSYINVNAEPIIMDDLFITLKFVERTDNSTTVDISINFDNYFLSNDNIELPLMLNVNAVCSYDLSINQYIYPQFWALRNVIDDYTGDVYAYSSILDIPNTDGQFAQQNEQIINNIAQQTEQQHQDVQNQLNATQQQTQQQHQDANSIMNGYDPSVGNQANTDFTNSTADLEAAEDTLFGKTSYDQIDYTQFDNFFSLESVGGAILFVKSALEAMYSSLGIFGIPISIGLVLLVFTRLIGFQNFTSGGG